MGTQNWHEAKDVKLTDELRHQKWKYLKNESKIFLIRTLQNSTLLALGLVNK